MNWDFAPILEILDEPLRNGCHQSGMTFGQGEKIVRMANLYKGMNIEISSLDSVNYPQPPAKSFHLQRGDILFNRTSLKKEGVGVAAIINRVNEIIYFDCSIIRLRCNQDVVDPFFLIHYLQTKRFREQMMVIAKTVTITTISQPDIISLSVPIPLLIEQKLIGNTISNINDYIVSLENLITKKYEIKQGAMQELLTEKTRLPGFTGSWEVKQLSNLCSDIKRGASPRPINNPKWFDNNSQIGWVRISDATSAKRYLVKTKQKLSRKGIQRSRYIPRGNLIMSICATVGRPIQTEIDVCIHDGFVIFENIQIDQNFLYYVLCDFEPRWSEKGQTGSQMNLNTELIKSTEISLPSDTKEQQAIAEVLSDMDAEIAALEQRLEKTKAIKQGMMQQLLTGRIRLVDPSTPVEASA